MMKYFADYSVEFTVRAIHGVQFPPTRLEGPQICYFETTHLEGWEFLSFFNKLIFALQWILLRLLCSGFALGQ